MKKIFTLLVLLMATVCVSAQQYYKGSFHSKVGDFNDYETTVAVTQGEGGKYTLVFESIVFGNDASASVHSPVSRTISGQAAVASPSLTKAATSAQLQNTISSCLTHSASL